MTRQTRSREGSEIWVAMMWIIGVVFPLTGCEQESSRSEAAKLASAKQAAPSVETVAVANPHNSALPPGHPPLDVVPPEITKPAPSAETLLPPGHPPLAGAPTESSAIAKPSAEADPAAGLPTGHPPIEFPGQIQFEVSEAWVAQSASSAMRMAQYALPRVEGDQEDGELIIFYFGPGEGGPVEANLARWRGMFTDGEGQPLPDDAGERDTFEVGGLRVTAIDITGRYAPATMPGTAARSPSNAFRMLAAVVETPAGPYFFRATGPTATMDTHAESIRAALKSVHQ